MNELKTYLEEHKDTHLDQLKDLLSIPSVSTDPERRDDVRRAAQWVKEAMEAAGLTARIDDTPGHPIVYGERLNAGADAPTILIYGHYDVQPPDPLELWDSGPFEPTIRDGKIVARGAADDKGQFLTHIKALEAHMAVRGELPVNVKVLIEGEEEIGSKNLAPYLEAHKEALASDVVVISDTHMFAPGVPSITYGLRGLTYFELEIEGPDHDLHSGLYGGGVANPINVLCDVIARLKDDSGRIQIEGFYDDVRDLTDEERAAWATLPFDEEGFRAEAGSEQLTGEAGFTTLERLWARPTLDCNGVVGGFTGEGAKTVLPSVARAKFSCRLVPDQDPRDIEDKVEAHLARIIPDSVRFKLTRMHGGQPVIVSTESDAIQAAGRALTEAFGGETVMIRGGGSIPVVADFKRILGVDSVLMGFGLPDDRLHSPNEKFDLAQYFGGILAAALFLDEIAPSA
ncbi:MAG: peptidase M20 [Myxococcales bacterium]|nr:peptidase M20 [Myxococcales bacterium]